MELPFFDKVKKAFDENLAEGADDTRFPIYPQRMVKLVREVMPEDGIIALDNGIYKIWYVVIIQHLNQIQYF